MIATKKKLSAKFDNNHYPPKSQVNIIEPLASISTKREIYVYL